MAAKHPDRKIPRPASRPLETLTKIAAQNLDGYLFSTYLLSRTVVPVVGSFKNKYSPLNHIPAEGEWQCIESLVRHIFGDQYELGLDYLQILYTMPLQKLPILLLVSEERNTGKSTFLNFLKLLFEANVTFNTNENFRSQFNDDWNGKLVIVVDEVLLNKREDSLRSKAANR